MTLFLPKIYHKCDDFYFEIVNFPFLDEDVPHSTSYGVYISRLIRFARASSHVVNFNTPRGVREGKLKVRRGWVWEGVSPSHALEKIQDMN